MPKKPELNPHFPSGSRTVTLDLEENQWWHLIYTLRGEIDNYRQLRLDLVNRGKEKYKEHIDLYTDSIRNTISLLETLETQIAPLYFTRDRQAEYRKRKLDTMGFD